MITTLPTIRPVRRVAAMIALAAFAVSLSRAPASAETAGVDAVIPTPAGWHHTKFPASRMLFGGQLVDAYESPSAPSEAIFIVALTMAEVTKTHAGATIDTEPTIDAKATVAHLIQTSTPKAQKVFVTDDHLCDGAKTAALARYSVPLRGGALPSTLLVKAASSGPYFIEIAYLRPSSHPTDSNVGAALHDACLPPPAALRAMYGHRR